MADSLGQGFAYYVANLAPYNKTYGTLGAIIALLVWLWINVAILLGAEVNAGARAKPPTEGRNPGRRARTATPGALAPKQKKRSRTA